MTPPFYLTPEAFCQLMAKFPLTFPFKIAVAVSGGADSMALALLLHEWVQKQGGYLCALTVDHQLRPESTKEAHQVHEWLSPYGIDHTILPWESPKPQSHLQEAARKARYELLESWCLYHRIPWLATAHHEDDVFETFFQRLAHGSGLTGLCGIPAYTQKPFGGLMRPLLSVSKSHLVTTLERFKQPYIEDPSNRNPAFSRVRWRQLSPLLQEQGLTPATLTKTIHRLQHAEATLETMVQRFLATHTRISALGYGEIEYDPWVQALPEIRHRLLIAVMSRIGKIIYPPSQDALKRLDTYLTQNPVRPSTLGSCFFFKKKEKLVCVHEHRVPLSPVPCSFPFLWDRRFLLEPRRDLNSMVPLPPSLFIGSLGPRRAQALAAILQSHHKILAPLPCLWEDPQGKGDTFFLPHFPSHSPLSLPVSVKFWVKNTEFIR